LDFPPDRFSPLRVAQIPFLVIAAPRDQGRVSQWRKTLDPGEAEALALAEELHAEIVLIDESVGRQVVTRAGFRVVGTLGILLQAKTNRWCDAVTPLLDSLQTELNFFVAPDLRSAVLEEAGES
jgi:hypothetical protein